MPDTLLDMLKRRKTEQATPTAPATGDLAQSISAGSGKAYDAGGVGMVSTVPEALAGANTRDALAGVADRGAIQQAGLGEAAAGIADSQTRLDRETASRAQTVSATAKRQSDAMLAEYESGKKTLRGDVDRADAEQLGTSIRLANDRYVADLMSAAQRDLIQSDSDFTKSFYEKEFGDSASLFGDSQAFRKIMAQDSDQFAKDLAQMDAGAAILAYKTMDKTRREQAPFAAVSSMIGGGADVAGAAAKKNNQPTEPWENTDETKGPVG